MLVANHAHSSDAPLGALTAEEIDRSLAVNVRATLLLAQAFHARHDGREGGRLVLMTSGQHRGPMPWTPAYMAGKGALHQLTLTLSAALADKRITVNCVDPGATDTGWASEETRAQVVAAEPWGRWGQPDDAARLIAFLCSEGRRVDHGTGDHLVRRGTIGPMHLRKLGRTGIEVSEIGYGAWGIGGSGWLGAQDDESLEALNRAIDLGVNLIDTALGYGDGHSEELVGQVVRERSETVYVSTKIPPKNGEWPAPDGIDPEEAYPAAHVIECTERSLRNTGLDALDVQQFHVWSDEWVGRGSWQEAIEQLKSEGKIRAFGVSINDHQPANAIKLIESGVVDTVQVIYNVFDQTPEDELLPACAEHGIGVLARVPLDEGALTGRIGAGHDVPGGRLPRPLLPRRPAAAGRRARGGAALGSRDLARRAGRGGAALRAVARRRLERHPGHADGPQRRAQHRARGRHGAAGRAGGAPAGAPLGPQLLRLVR